MARCYYLNNTMYRIRVLDKANTPITTLPEFDTQIRSFGKVINKAGKCLFAISKSSPYAKKSNFNIFNRIIISRWNCSVFVDICGFNESFGE